MNSNSLRTANAIASARQILLSRSSLCGLEKTRLLQRNWIGERSTKHAGAERRMFSCCRGLEKQRMMSTTSSLRATTVQNARAKQLRYKSRTQEFPPESEDWVTPEIPTWSRQYTFFFYSGIMVFIWSTYSAILYTSYRNTVSASKSLAVPSDVSDRYDKIANEFDSDVDLMERYMWLTSMRKKLVSKAVGDVCEVSIGTGRNLTYYNWDFGGRYGKVGDDNKVMKGTVRSFTAVDKSKEMLEVAHEKFTKEYPGILGIRWVVQDASEPLPPPPVSANERSGNKTGKKFDTIIQTFGLCSTPDPVALLKNLGESVEPSGKILLLEHGRGSYDWINNILDGLAPSHADRFGCWWNKDIGKIVEESGLEVVKMKRKHFGTTWWIELRPKRSGKITKKDQEK